MSELGAFGIGMAGGLLIVAVVLWAQRAQVRASWRQLKRSSGEDSGLPSARAGPVWLLAGATALTAGVGFADSELLVAIPSALLCAVSTLVAIRLRRAAASS